jgi:signal recognition particle subunit SRP54
MTPFEKANPRRIDGSRKLRIANGSGSTVNKVSQLLKQFEKVQKQMKGMGGMLKNMPQDSSSDLDPNEAMGSIMGGVGPGSMGASMFGSNKGNANKRKKKKKKGGGKKGVSGNPAKR